MTVIAGSYSSLVPAVALLHLQKARLLKWALKKDHWCESDRVTHTDFLKRHAILQSLITVSFGLTTDIGSNDEFKKTPRVHSRKI